MIALRLYRAIPRRLRTRMIKLVPQGVQLRMARRLVRVRVSRVRAAAGDLIGVRDGGADVRARVARSTSPLRVWKANLDFVTAALEGAGIEHFCIKHSNPYRSAVAVPDRLRDQVVNALNAAKAPDLTLRFVRGRASRDAVLQVCWTVTDPTTSMVLGRRHSCEVEFWHSETDDQQREWLVAPRANPVGRRVPAKGESALVGGEVLSDFVSPGEATSRKYQSRPEFAGLSPQSVTFPIDVVYTWVDGSDPDWQLRKQAVLEATDASAINGLAANVSRFTSRDELRYSMRSVFLFAPWVRRIYLVTDDQVPPWLDVDHPWITVVTHRELFAGTGQLPTFNSHAIESRLHMIPGLAEHFIYINDDMFLGRPLLPTAFFHANGVAKFFTSPAQLELGEASVDDAPVTAAGKNNRSIIQARFGRTITQKMKHVPYPLLRSVLEEIERALPAEIAATASHQFRHPADLSIPSSLQHYWSYLTGRAVPGKIGYSYSDLAHPSTPMRLAYLLQRRSVQVFCLNDTDSESASLEEQHRMLSEFLPAYYPFRAPFEVDEDVERQRRASTSTALARMLLVDG